MGDFLSPRGFSWVHYKTRSNFVTLRKSCRFPFCPSLASLTRDSPPLLTHSEIPSSPAPLFLWPAPLFLSPTPLARAAVAASLSPAPPLPLASVACATFSCSSQSWLFLLKSRKSSSSAEQTALSCSTTVAAFSGSTTAATNAGAPRLPRPARRSTGTGDAAAAAGSTRRGGPANAVAALADEGEFELPGDFNFIVICADQVEYLLEVQVHPLLVENNSDAYDSLDSGGNITIKWTLE
ncbi:uncharacterized protein [Triticum aestivum]|uniref:uncharacterized protein n=1 Tax=Triticum aestivum TaxID=4565 RepID=UPI001D01B27C|nr:uncharacterized protein LOC123129440 [Triticum aestivum]